ncbi:hypothetical protein CLV42_104574 [Chitinophaga ginsengisoli]|uniref:Uncharacterized protein n=1 Tax=Chitinophaga ginsengisoli TaxID=363837 RepID=A0A2P8GE82_9BACT|nr:hypothetical protein CLV42_104574 [Chitinophaga ginsengisoli]
MFDLGKEKIEIKCECGRKHTVTFRDAINRKLIKCACGSNIQLNDGNGSVRKSVNDTNRAFKDLDDTLKRLGKI